MALPTTYDDLFLKHSDGIPIEFLRALTMKESGFNPIVNSKGLMQVTSVARKDYNQNHPGEAVSKTQLLDPETNIKIGTWLLRRYANHLNTAAPPMLREDWLNSHFVTALVAGWNSGVYGYVKAARRVASRGETPTHDRVMAEWRKTEPFLASAEKERWQRGVTNLYMTELKAAGNEIPPSPPPSPPASTPEAPTRPNKRPPVNEPNHDNSGDERSGIGGALLAGGLLAGGLLAWGLYQWR